MADQASQQLENPSEQRVEFPFNARHNICAFVDKEHPGVRDYVEIINFLYRSRIFKAITAECSIFKSHQVAFWESARLDNEKSPRKITGYIGEQVIEITEDILRRMLDFEDSQDDKIYIDTLKVRGCLLRCGYSAKHIEEGSVNKRYFSPQFKYLAHILIHCLGPRKSGHDQMNKIMQNALASLVLRIPFNFSRMIFIFLTENLSVKKEKFFMYPRFLQMIINEQAPDLTKEDADLLVLDNMTDYSVRSMGTYKGKQERPRNKRLFGHLLNNAYVCPPERKWRNEGSDSEVEDIVIPESSETEERHESEHLHDEGEDETAEVEQYELKERKRPRLAFKRRTTITTAQPESTTTPPPPESAHTVNPPTQGDTVLATSSTQTTEQLAILNSLMVKMMGDHQKQQEEMEKIMAENRERAEREKKMNEDYLKLADNFQSLQTLLLKETAERMKQEERVKELEARYDEISTSMMIDDDGFYRVNDREDDILELGAGTSGTRK